MRHTQSQHQLCTPASWFCHVALLFVPVNEYGAAQNKSTMKVRMKGNMRNMLKKKTKNKSEAHLVVFFIIFPFLSSLTLLLFKLVLRQEDGPHQLPDRRLNGHEEFPGVSAERGRQHW